MALEITTKRLWYTLLGVFAATVLLFVLTPARFDPAGLPKALMLTFGAGLCFAALTWRKQQKGIEHPWVHKLKTLCEGLVFLSLSSLIGSMYNHLTMMLPFPYQDELLARMDQALGVNWLAYFEFVHDHPALIRVMDISYVHLGSVYLIALAALILRGDMRRGRFFMEIYFFAALAFITVGAAFPALAAVDRYIPDLAIYTNFDLPPGVYHIPFLEALRDTSGEVVLSAAILPGLVTFPSFHTASGVLLGVCFFRTWLFWPMTLYSTVMIASSPVFGGHYFIDIFAGGLLALIAAFGLAHTPAYRGLFGARVPKGSLAAPEMA